MKRLISNAEQRNLEEAGPVWELLIEVLKHLLVEKGFKITELRSDCGDKIILCVTISEERLLSFAEHSGYEVQLDKHMLVEKLDMLDLPEDTTAAFVPFRPHHHDHGILRTHDEFHTGKFTVLRTVDRIRLCQDVIHSISDLGLWRHLTLPIEFFPAHNEKLLATLRASFFIPLVWRPTSRSNAEMFRKDFHRDIQEAKGFAEGKAAFEGRNVEVAGKQAEAQMLWKLMQTDAELDRLRNYFGERIAFYFAFLAHIGKHLLPLSALSVALHIYEVVCAEDYEPAKSWSHQFAKSVAGQKLYPTARAVYGLFTIGWMANLCAHWRRREVELGNRWGCESLTSTTVACQKHVQFDSVKEELAIREENEILHQNSSTSLAWETESTALVSHHRRHAAIRKRETEQKKLGRRRFWGRVFSWTCFTVYMCAVILTTGAILWWRYTVEAELHENPSKFDDRWVPPLTWTSIALSLQMQIYTRVWPYLSKPLTEMERHELEKDFVTAYGVKNTAVDFVSAFAALFYDAFGKQPFDETVKTVEGQKIHESVDLLVSDITCLFGVYGICGLMEFLLPFLSLKFRQRGSEGSEDDDNDGLSSQVVQDQVNFDVYDSDCDAYDYEEILFPLMFVGLFSIPMPLASILALIIVVSQAIVDRQKLLRFYRRPYPDMAQGIGIWQNNLLTSISHLAAFTNLGLIVFGLELLPAVMLDSLTKKWLVFLVGEQVFIVLGVLIQMLIYGVPTVIMAERQRQWVQRGKVIALNAHSHL